MRRDPDALLATRAKKRVVPFDFVLEELAGLDPWTRPMFGSTAVYVDEKIVFVLRDGKADTDNGVWVATTKELHASLRKELPTLRSIAVFGVGETGWQVIPFDSEEFEENVLRACALVRAGDPRIGKIPKAKTKKKTSAASKKRTTGGPRAKQKR